MTARATGPDAAGKVAFAATGRLLDLDEAAVRQLMERAGTTADITRDVTAIIDLVRREGDAALLRMAAELDGASLDALEVPRDAIERALDDLDPPIRGALEQAASAIEAFHRAQLPAPLDFEPMPGVRLSRRPDPLERVGVYAPGGRAAYPSSVLMGVVPARVAGVGEVVVCSPPGRDGLPSPIVLAACAVAGADRVFATGGAGAIAALAYGTASIPPVARVVGPGNAWVTEAKRQLHGTIAIDCPAGPSEILILADENADPHMLAAELVAQAEHDPDAAAVLVAADEPLVDAVEREIAELVDGHPRAGVVTAAFRARGALLHGDRETAIRFATAYAPEHLLIAMGDAASVAHRMRNAGTIFVGESSSVAFGDYITGANHVLPTGGTAKSFSGLNVLDFIRWTTIQQVSPRAAETLAQPTALLAEAEGLPGHAFAARLRARASGSGAGGPRPGRALSARTADQGRTPPRTRMPRTRPAYAAVSTYDPGRTPVAVDLSDNTNLFGICPAVAQAMSDVSPQTTGRYPSVYADALVRAAAERFGVDAAEVVSGCGSDDIIDSAIRAFCEPGDVVAHPWPTFGIVPVFARMNATTPVPVEDFPGGGLDARGLLAAGPRLIYLCRPNNPTGHSVPAAEVMELAADSDGVVLVDEAYADFAEDNLLREAVRSRNVIVLRTMSKAYGMAGLRVGFAVGPEHLVREVAKSRGPYKVSGVAERAGEAALRDGGPWVADCVRRTRENRTRLFQALRTAGYDVLGSDANFLLLRLSDGSGGARAVADRLRSEHGVGVRPFESLAGLGDCLRVTVGPWDMMQAFLDSLEAVAAAHGRSGSRL